MGSGNPSPEVSGQRAGVGMQEEQGAVLWGWNPVPSLLPLS